MVATAIYCVTIIMVTPHNNDNNNVCDIIITIHVKYFGLISIGGQFDEL